MKTPYGLLCTLLGSSILIACGGGGGGSAPPPTPTAHQVTISWAANRETAVNSAGGGYKVAITGQPVKDVPYLSGASTATNTTVTLMSGSYTATVTAYSAYPAIDPNTGLPTGGTSSSLQSTSIPINVPY